MHPVVPLEGKLRTKSRDNRCLLTVLALEAVRNPRAILANGRHAADAGEHIARCHNQGSEDGDSCPGPAAAEDRGKESNRQRARQDKEGHSAPHSPVNRWAERDAHGRECGELFSKWLGVEAAVERGVMCTSRAVFLLHLRREIMGDRGVRFG